ncbi:MAG: hypothetical protein ABSH05_27980 [Bryobacteraceae bacterium]
MQRHTPRRARTERRTQQRAGSKITVRVLTGAPADPAVCSWRCSQCGATGKAVLINPDNINFIATLRERPEVTGVPLHLLRDPLADAGSILKIHRRRSPLCQAAPMIDLRPAAEQSRGSSSPRWLQNSTGSA